MSNPLPDQDGFVYTEEAVSPDDVIAHGRRWKAERDAYLARLDEQVVRAQRNETALRLIRDELSNGVTANWDFIEQQFSRALDEMEQS